MREESQVEKGVLETELAWAAGFFDGEGSVYVRHTKRHKGGTTGRDYPLLTVEMSLAQVRREPLERFYRAVGCGKLGGPYKPRTKNHSPSYRWCTGGRPSTHKVLSLLWPYLSGPKKQQAQKCWRELEAKKTAKSPKLPRLPGKWYGVDLDGTLAFDNGWENGGAIGEPVPEMLERVKGWLNAGIEVRVVTARVAPIYEDAEDQRFMIEDWTEKHLGVRLAVTNGKDGHMKELWDDRAVQVVKNTGERVGRIYRDLPRD